MAAAGWQFHNLGACPVKSSSQASLGECRRMSVFSSDYVQGRVFWRVRCEHTPWLCSDLIGCKVIKGNNRSSFVRYVLNYLYSTLYPYLTGKYVEYYTACGGFDVSIKSDFLAERYVFILRDCVHMKLAIKRYSHY